jgi:hypothetical protein
MTEREFLASEECARRIQKARSMIRLGGGNGKIVIELDYKDDRYLSGGIDARVSSGRVNAKQFTPE